VALSIVRHTIFVESIQAIINIERSEFKEASHGGMIFVRSRPVDKGNAKYSILFNFLYRMCEKDQLEKGQQDALRGMCDLIARYSTLNIHSETTQSSMSMKGDVIEYILELCRYTGPHVDEEVKEAREQMHDFIKRFMSELEALEHVLFNHNCSGPPRHCDRLDPYWFVRACVLAICIDDADGGKRDRLSAEFAHAVSQMQC
jgi:hypothetical protein